LPVRLYEGMYIVRPEVGEEELQALMSRVADVIAQIGGTIDLHDIWERRELAYQIDGCKRGTYCICYFNAESTSIDALRQELDLEEQVLRHLVVVANPKAIWRPVSAEPAPAEAEAAEPAPAGAEEAQPAAGPEAAEGEAEQPSTEPAGADEAQQPDAEAAEPTESPEAQDAKGPEE
jgi:small subunit ribosomal protein S6